MNYAKASMLSKRGAHIKRIMHNNWACYKNGCHYWVGTHETNAMAGITMAMFKLSDIEAQDWEYKIPVQVHEITAELINELAKDNPDHEVVHKIIIQQSQKSSR
jgi:hypothetical protein